MFQGFVNALRLIGTLIHDEDGFTRHRYIEGLIIQQPNHICTCCPLQGLLKQTLW
jgi:hypothetical protein